MTTGQAPRMRWAPAVLRRAVRHGVREDVLKSFSFFAGRTGAVTRVRLKRNLAVKYVLDATEPFLTSGQRLPEISTFLEILDDARVATICEIGTYQGSTTLVLSRCVQTARLVIGIDPHIRRRAIIRALVPAQVSLKLLQGYSNDSATLARARDVLGARSLDCLFIDGDHSYQGVRSDFEMYSPLVRDGGIIALHDIVPDHATRLGPEAGRGWAGDVPRFWAEVRDGYRNVEIVADTDQDGCGIGVLWKP